MSNVFRATNAFGEENARPAAPKPSAVEPARPLAARRALGEVPAPNAAHLQQAKPVARAPVFAPIVAAQPGAGGAAPADAGRAGDFAFQQWAAPELPAFDRADVSDPAFVTDYVSSIYQYYRTVEGVKHARHGYMTQQTDINEKMRAILIDWLVEVHLKFKLMPETMYLTVNLIDRYLELRPVQRTKLQLVGVTAMLLASKYEEIYAPEVRDFVYITDKAYTKEQILAMEATMLNTLGFKITVPTTHVFVTRFLKVTEGDKDPKIVNLATYFVERTLQEYPMTRFLPSRIAAAGVNMAIRTVRGRNAWDASISKGTGFAQEDLREPIQCMQALLDGQGVNNLKAVHKKYSGAKYGEVALMHCAALE